MEEPDRQEPDETDSETPPPEETDSAESDADERLVDELDAETDDADEQTPDEVVREAVERSRSGAPAVGAVVRDRFSSDEIFQRVVAAADEEVTSEWRELFFSAVAGGFAITITFLLYVSLYATTEGDPVLSTLLYPLGFIYIIIGGYQLYTENTLPPVALTLERLTSLPTLLRHWLIVLAGNFAGGAIGAAVLAWGGVFSPEAVVVASDLAQHGIETPARELFFKGAFAGLIVAGVVWVEYAARDTISRIVVVYLAFLAIPLGDLFHVVVSFTEVTFVIFSGDFAAVTGLYEFVLPVLLGNTIGGVVLVTVINYYQTSEHRLDSARFTGAFRRLSLREWLLGGLVGRSYVPLIDTAETSGPGEAAYRVLVPITNPRTESSLVELACTLASTHESAAVHVLHVVQVPDEMSFQYGDGQRQRIVEESERRLTPLEDLVDGYDLHCETSTVVSYRSFEEIFDTARREETDIVVMGWARDGIWSGARAERPLNELTQQLPCDFLVLKDRDLDTSRILLPTAGGPDSELSADVARTLATTVGSNITLLHVVDGPDERGPGQQFIGSWAADHDLEDADVVIDDSGDVERAICREASEHTFLVIGATERGLLSRLVRGSLHFDVIDEVECSVLLAERPSDRPILGRLFGRR